MYIYIYHHHFDGPSLPISIPLALQSKERSTKLSAAQTDARRGTVRADDFGSRSEKPRGKLMISLWENGESTAENCDFVIFYGSYGPYLTDINGMK